MISIMMGAFNLVAKRELHYKTTYGRLERSRYGALRLHGP